MKDVIIIMQDFSRAWQTVFCYWDPAVKFYSSRLPSIHFVHNRKTEASRFSTADTRVW